MKKKQHTGYVANVSMRLTREQITHLLSQARAKDFDGMFVRLSATRGTWRIYIPGKPEEERPPR